MDVGTLTIYNMKMLNFKSISLQLIIVTLWSIQAIGAGTNRESNSAQRHYISNKSFFKLPDAAGRSKRASEDVAYNIGQIVAYTAEEKENIQQRHVELRGQVTPEASNMEYMYWDDDLATMGEQWSSACLWEHGQPDNISPYSSLGQNLWRGSGSLATEPDPVPAVNAWYNEDQYYTYDSNSCSHVCGHYTQIVWASSMYVGCGRAFCPTVTDGDNTPTDNWIVTCNYAPAGNYVGQKPFKSGDTCTQCDSGIGTCHTNQCRRNCDQDGVTCECKAECQNCGNLTDSCSCTCQSGWYGSDCNKECIDTHENCGANPGWPNAGSCSLGAYVPVGCPLMCGVCEAATGDEVCDGAVSFKSGGYQQLLVTGVMVVCLSYWM